MHGHPPHGHLRTPAPSFVAPGDTAGLRHVEEALRDLEFPMTRDELLARAGAWRMPITGARFVRLDEMMAHVQDRRFASLEDVLRALDK